MQEWIGGWAHGQMDGQLTGQVNERVMMIETHTQNQNCYLSLSIFITTKYTSKTLHTQIDIYIFEKQNMQRDHFSHQINCYKKICSAEEA